MPGPTVTTVQPTMSTDVLFRAWGSTINAALTAAGLVQTADTGQINWTTVTRATAGSFAGYEIWKFNDTLQATAPIYLKVEYGSTIIGNTIPQIALTTGTGSDGAGNLTSLTGTGTSVSARNICASNSASDGSYPAGAQPVYVNGDGSGVVLACFPNASGSHFGFGFLVERFRNWDGTANGDGFITTWFGSGSNGGSLNKSQVIYFSATVVQPNAAATHTPSVLSTMSGVNAAAIPSCVVGNTLYPLPILPSWGGKLQAPSALALVVARTDCAAAAQFTCTHYGVSHTWAALGAGGTAAGFIQSAATSGWSLLVRID